MKFLFFDFRSACLLMQISIPCLLFANATSNLVVKGGTNAEMAPPIDYFEKVRGILLISNYAQKSFKF